MLNNVGREHVLVLLTHDRRWFSGISEREKKKLKDTKKESAEPVCTLGH
jgi:hypothetical protein